QAARWIEQVLPFSLILLVVFIRQHLQGFFVTIWIAAVMFKSNDILRKQTALKCFSLQGERKIPILIGISFVFGLHVIVVYWWYWNYDILYPLIMVPPKAIPPFWHAIFIIMVNDTLVRQAAMVLKCILLMYYKNSRGRNYRRQGQMLTLVEYLLLLYRVLLPAPVWYRFFLNKEYGSLFSSLMIGLYLTFKLTSIVEKVQSFFAALKALSRKESHYGAYATSEQDWVFPPAYETMLSVDFTGFGSSVEAQDLWRYFGSVGSNGSNPNFGGVSASAIPCLVASTSLVQSFFAALKALSRKESHYGPYATSEQGERKIPILIGISFVFGLHVIIVYWWYWNDDIRYPMIMVPPKAIPPFWHAIFIIMVNDTLVRQAAMVLKCILLMYYKNSRGQNYRRQVQSFFAALKALSRKESHYSAYATSEQVRGFDVI
ncbi:RING finger and transmembrane domain-containing protein 2, partial [Camellia lanceoleosa]